MTADHGSSRRAHLEGFEEASVFDEFNGLPMHPLVVHAAVVFVPLLCLLAVVYAVVPRVRLMVGWAAAALAVAAPAVAWVATRSGAALAETRYAGQIPPAVQDHQQYGDRAMYASIALGLVTLVLVFLTRTTGGTARPLPSWAQAALAVVVVVLAAVTGWFVFLTGDSGASSVWGS
jgi:hypothetical protein